MSLIDRAINSLGRGYDRLVGICNPAEEAKRIILRSRTDRVRSAQYAAAKTDRQTGGWTPTGANINTIIKSSSVSVRNRVRQLTRDFPHFFRAGNSLVDFSVGTGIVPQARVKQGKGFDKKLNQKIEDEQNYWFEQADDSTQFQFFCDDKDGDGRFDHYEERINGLLVRRTDDDDQDGRWEVCTSATLGRHSSIGYHLIRDIQEKFQGLPVGMIEASWSSRGAECFMAREWLEADPELEPTLAQTDRSIRNWRAAMARYEATPAAERTEETPRLPQSRPPFIYNAMIAPVIPYGMRGAVWYQGESNILRAEQYRHLLPALIRSWRKAWGQGDFPFLIVQLANYEPRPKTESPPFESEVAELREAQMSALALPRTAVVVSCDLGEGTDVHPLGRAGIDFRKMVAGRLGNAALSVAYGREGSDSAIPSYRAMSVEGDAIRIDFANPNGGLVARGSLEGFAVAGADRNFEPAEARLEGGSVIVRSSLVSCPVAVRYAWLANPKMSLYDRSGRPVAPFRTDDWPGLTAGRRTVEANDPAL